MIPAPQEAFERFLEVLDRQEVQYFVGGSGASSVYGFWRATADIDVVAQLAADDVAPLVAALESEFYVDAGQALQAIDHHRSFNLVHFASGFKLDVFPLTEDAYQQAQFSRRRFTTAPLFSGEPVEFCVASPEDVVLGKLHWYRLGGETSEQQWRDVLGVLAVQGRSLDLDYARRWAEYLGIAGLLERALAERPD